MTNPKRQLGVFILGGTIDSRNDPALDGEVVPMKESLVSKYLESLQTSFDMKIKRICIKDSRSVNDHDRTKLCRQIESVNLSNNIVTHGTYTIGQTARFLFNNDMGDDRVIVLTGGMGTLLGGIDETGRLAPSDAQFNLGYAISEAFTLQNGVYVSMNGNSFKQPDEEWVHDKNGVHWTGQQ